VIEGWRVSNLYAGLTMSVEPQLVKKSSDTLSRVTDPEKLQNQSYKKPSLFLSHILSVAHPPPSED
jgi:hypothetical protein